MDARFVVPVVGDAHFRSDWRQKDRLASVDQLIEECRAEAVGLWAIPGDLYDAGSDVASRNAWVDRIRAMADRAPVVLCYGNHDRPGELYALGALGARWPIRVVERPETLAVKTPQGPVVAVFVLPYPYPAGLVAQGVPPSEVGAVARAALDAILIDAGQRLTAARAAGQPTLCVGHATIGGAVVSTGQPLIGQEIELDEALLLRLGEAPKIFNHIHKPQALAGAVIPGSVAAMSWGETEEKRYVRVVYTHGPAGWTWQIESRPLRTPPLVLVEARFEELACTYSVDPATVPEAAQVRVRVRFAETERQFFDVGRRQVLEAFAHVAAVQVEPICEADRGLRAPEVAAAQTLVEKVTAWCAANGETVPPGLVEALAQLETWPGEAVVAACRQEVEALMAEATRTVAGAMA